jgi:hypothetical protein
MTLRMTDSKELINSPCICESCLLLTQLGFRLFLNFLYIEKLRDSDTKSCIRMKQDCYVSRHFELIALHFLSKHVRRRCIMDD